MESDPPDPRHARANRPDGSQYREERTGLIRQAVHRWRIAGYRTGQPILNLPMETPMAETTDDRLRLLIERIERLEEEKKGIADDIRDVYMEAKAVGYDPKIMRQIVRLRKMKPDDRSEQDMLLETYKNALGMA
jgi:uncharacterized protein (UPF0335 family)